MQRRRPVMKLNLCDPQHEEKPGDTDLGALMRCRVPESNSGETQRQPCSRGCPWRRKVGQPYPGGHFAQLSRRRGQPRCRLRRRGNSVAAWGLHHGEQLWVWGFKPAGSNLDRDICGAGVVRAPNYIRVVPLCVRDKICSISSLYLQTRTHVPP